MPFTKITKGKDVGKFKSSEGRVFTEKQVKMYNATNGFQKSKVLEYNLGRAMKSQGITG